jgi:hypothetical protein
MPAWFSDRTVALSPIAPYAEGALHVTARMHTEGDLGHREHDNSATDHGDEFAPQPVWETTRSPDREPATDEVEARKVLLAGNLAMWLDDGDRIRALDPAQPAGERVTYAEVGNVRQGTYLLVRKGMNDRGALYQAALGLLGARSGAIDATQRRWKQALLEQLSERRYRAAVGDMKANGIKTADRARAWADPNLIRPHSDRDFERLLTWLRIPIEPTFGHASSLRRMLYQASADVRDKLETAVSGADLGFLERDGQLSLDLPIEGFRGILATRVLAIAPHTEIVARRDARVPFSDRSGQWLE